MLNTSNRQRIVANHVAGGVPRESIIWKIKYDVDSNKWIGLTLRNYEEVIKKEWLEREVRGRVPKWYQENILEDNKAANKWLALHTGARLKPMGRWAKGKMIAAVSRSTGEEIGGKELVLPTNGYKFHVLDLMGENCLVINVLNVLYYMGDKEVGDKLIPEMKKYSPKELQHFLRENGYIV